MDCPRDVAEIFNIWSVPGMLVFKSNNLIDVSFFADHILICDYGPDDPGPDNAYFFGVK